METSISYQQLLKNQCASIVEKVLRGMNQEKHLIKVGVDENLPPRKPILYRWWFPASFVEQIANKYQQEKHSIENVMENVECRKIHGKVYYALYFGKSNNGLRRYHQHAARNVYSSTIRHTIYGLCIGDEYVEANEKRVTDILKKCYCEWIDFPNDGKLIECIEGICIALGHYPLNVDGNPSISTEWHSYLMNKRKVKNVR